MQLQTRDVMVVLNMTEEEFSKWSHKNLGFNNLIFYYYLLTTTMKTIINI